MTTSSPTYPGASQTPATTTANVTGGGGNDTLVGAAGNDTIDGGAGFNIVEYAGSEYDYIITRNENGSVTVAASAGTPYTGDGTDQLLNIQLIRFLDGASERIIDDVSNLQSATNVQLSFGQEFSGQMFKGDADWFSLSGAPNQPFHVVIVGGTQASLAATVPLTGIQSASASYEPPPVSLTQLQDVRTSPYTYAWGALNAAGTASLSVGTTGGMQGGYIPLNEVRAYRLTVLRDLIGTAGAETLNGGSQPARDGLSDNRGLAERARTAGGHVVGRYRLIRRSDFGQRSVLGVRAE